VDSKILFSIYFSHSTVLNVNLITFVPSVNNYKYYTIVNNEKIFFLYEEFFLRSNIIEIKYFSIRCRYFLDIVVNSKLQFY